MLLFSYQERWREGPCEASAAGPETGTVPIPAGGGLKDKKISREWISSYFRVRRFLSFNP